MKTIVRSTNISLEAQMPRILSLFALVVLAVSLSGCTSSEQNAMKIDPSGVYSLIRVDGKTVPCEVTHQKTPMTIKSGVFTINADGTCHSMMKFSVAGHEDVSRKVKATYKLRDSELTMKWDSAGTTVGSVDGNRFTMTNEGMVLVYEK